MTGRIRIYKKRDRSGLHWHADVGHGRVYRLAEWRHAYALAAETAHIRRSRR